jgi:hypothetical protein
MQHELFENTVSGLLERCSGIYSMKGAAWAVWKYGLWSARGMFSTVWKMQHELFEPTASGLLEGWCVLYSMKDAAWAVWKYDLWSARGMVCFLQCERCSMSCLNKRPLVCSRDGLFSTVWKMQHELFENTASGLLEGWSLLYRMKDAAWAVWKYDLWSAV